MVNIHVRNLQERTRLEVAILEEIKNTPSISALEIAKRLKTTDTNVRKTLLPYLKDGIVRITKPCPVSYCLENADKNS